MLRPYRPGASIANTIAIQLGSRRSSQILFSLQRILLIQFPHRRILCDISARVGDFLAISQHSLKIISLPNFPVPAKLPSRLSRHGRFERSDRLTNAGFLTSESLPSRGAACCAPTATISTIPCKWFGMITNSCKFTFAKCRGIASQHSRTVSPSTLSLMWPSWKAPRTHFLSEAQIVTK